LIGWTNIRYWKTTFQEPLYPAFTVSPIILYGGKSKYGQGYYDYSEGGMTFVASTQVIGKCGYDVADVWAMYTLLIHPDFLYPLAKKIKQYVFFS